MLRITIVLLLGIILLPGKAQTQVNAENSYWLPNKGTIRLFVVFAETVGDPLDKNPAKPAWPKGQMPKDPDAFFDHRYTNEKAMKGYLTRYFHKASFGEYIVLGDYYPKVISVPYKKLRRGGVDNVIEHLNSTPGNLVRTKHGYSTSGKDFDHWTIPTKPGLPKEEKSDGFLDCLVVIWRVNSKVQRVDNSGYIFLSNLKTKVKGKKGFSAYSQFISSAANAFDILKHEYSHSLYGGNNFHNGGAGAGQRTWMSSMSGWSNMNSWDHSLGTWNGWDRHRMGWTHPKKELLISAVDQAGKELNTDLSIVMQPEGGTFILRDFATTGDAVRIKLPHIKKPTSSQYLWLENHRLNSEFNENERMRPGLLAYIQVGKDNKRSFDEPGNYTTPVPASGRHDFIFHSPAGILEQVSGRENPLTGYHYLMRQAVDMNDDGKIKNELFNANKVRINGVQREHYPCFGNPDDAYGQDDMISLGSNPTATPVLTYATPAVGRNRSMNNKTIWLNGVYVEVLNANFDGRGAVQVKVGWDNYEINDDVRWCGPITLQAVANDPKKRPAQVVVAKKALLLLDQGYTPTKDEGTKGTDGRWSYTNRTRLQVRSNASIELMPKAKLVMKNRASLLVNRGGTIILHHKSRVSMEAAAQFAIKGGEAKVVKKSKELVIADPATVPVSVWKKVKWGKMKKYSK